MPAEESALLVPALAMDQLVQDYRLSYDPSARAGVPPHITIMAPFVEPARLGGALLKSLDDVIAGHRAFDYVFQETREFDDGILYLAPEPSAPFIRLTEAVGASFGLRPYGGIHTLVVPHLTVATSAPAEELTRIRQLLRTVLPQTCSATEAWLMVGSNDRGWRRAHVARLG